MKIVYAGFLAPALLCASDTILVHGHIYTGNTAAPWVQGIAITGEHIDSAGSDEDTLRHHNPRTKVIDLKGRTVIPGLIDSHAHMWMGGMALRGFSINVSDEQAAVSSLKTYALAHPADVWLVGKGTFAAGNDTGPSHELLDLAVADRPVVAHSGDEHSIFVNGKALALAHITNKPAANPAEERGVVRDARGEPTGLLKEAAMDLIARVQPDPTMEQKLEVARAAQQALNRNGITSVVNATGDSNEIEVYAALRDRHELTVRTRTAFGNLGRKHSLTPAFLAELDRTRKRYHDDWVSANLVKFFMDGVIESHTAAMLAPYSDQPGSRGASNYSAEEFTAIVQELDRRGYQVMTHALGDAAVRMTLDAYGEAGKRNGPRDRRFRIEHMETIDPADVPRFGFLSVIPSMMPLHCCSANTRFIGEERLPHGFLWKSLEEGSGNRLIMNSDWPAGPLSPFRGIQQAVMRELRRRGPAGTAPASYMPEQRLTVEQTIAALTWNGAYADFMETKTGTLERGKKADLVVLSQDIFSVPANQIGMTTALLTMVGGRVVFDTDAPPAR